MNREIIELLESNPIILGVNSDDDLEIAIKHDAKIIFTLYGDIANIINMVSKLKEAGKIVFVNVDMVDGFANRNSVIKFMRSNTSADGIISSKASMIRSAKELGFVTIHRFFVLDSASYRSIGKQLELSKTDIINIVPGWPKVIEWTVNEHRKPVIAAGLVCDKSVVIDCLNAGAVAICSTNHDIWEL